MLDEEVLHPFFSNPTHIRSMRSLDGSLGSSPRSLGRIPTPSAGQRDTKLPGGKGKMIHG